MKKTNGYKKCDFEDLDPFQHCKPVNCELKYSGKRNFFQSPSCVPVKLCDQGYDWIYHYETNDCRNLQKILTEKEIEDMKEGKFTNWVDSIIVERSDRDLFKVNVCQF